MARLYACYSLPQKKACTCIKAKYSKTMETRGKVGGVPHPPFNCSKLDQASFWISKRWRHRNKKSGANLSWEISQNSKIPWHWLQWSWCRISNFCTGPPQFWVLGPTKVDTFFWGRLYEFYALPPLQVTFDLIGLESSSGLGAFKVLQALYTSGRSKCYEFYALLGVLKVLQALWTSGCAQSVTSSIHFLHYRWHLI